MNTVLFDKERDLTWKNNVVIFFKGDLFQKDFSIVFNKNNQKIYIPINNIKELYGFY